jgi:septum formation protein
MRFEVRESGIPESFDPQKDVGQNVRAIALEKARAVVRPSDDAIIIGADTVVVLDGAILTKPTDAEDAIRMLSALSGRMHEVYTGFALLDCKSGKSVSAAEVTKVTFRSLAPGEIRNYVASGSPMDKAGAYGIQDDYGAVFVERVDGCFYNVVGFPLTRFYVTLIDFEKQLGVN